MPFLDTCSDPSTVFRYLLCPAPLFPFFPTSLRVFLRSAAASLSHLDSPSPHLPSHSLGDVRESSPFLLTCRESGSLQGDGIRCRFIHETGCSPSYQPTDPLQSPAALVLLSLFASLLGIVSSLLSPRSIHRLALPLAALDSHR